jgi:hypothetical protein
MNYGIVAVSDQPELAPLLATCLLDECRHPATTTLSERLHSSGGEVARNDRHGRNPEWLELAESCLSALEHT